MKEPGIPYDVSVHFDENLRDVADSREGMEQAARYNEERLRSDTMSAREKIRLLGITGVYRRILGDLQKAQEHLEQALSSAREVGDEKLALVNTLRLAHVYQWLRQYAASDSLFRSVLVQCETNQEFSSYLDFACQHYGKSKFDQGLYGEAAGLFERALQLRQSKGDAELIESSLLALRTAQAKLGPLRTNAQEPPHM